MRHIIGITGAFGSGKSTAAKYFESKGYKMLSLSSFLEREAVKRNLPLTRKILQDLGNEFREKEGSGVLMKKALLEHKDEQKLVIDGLRNLEELEELKRIKGSLVLGIVADRKIRLNRLRKLKRRESLDKDLFLKLELRDLGVGEKTSGLQTAFCISLADVYISSNHGYKEFYHDLDKFLKEYEK